MTETLANSVDKLHLSKLQSLITAVKVLQNTSVKDTQLIGLKESHKNLLDQSNSNMLGIESKFKSLDERIKRLETKLDDILNELTADDLNLN